MRMTPITLDLGGYIHRQSSITKYPQDIPQTIQDRPAGKRGVSICRKNRRCIVPSNHTWQAEAIRWDLSSSKTRRSTNNMNILAGHSFRIGAATTAAKAGVEDSTIRIMGRCNSMAFLVYIRTPREELA